MALTTCKKCGGQISDKAAYCVHCGEPLHPVIIVCPSCKSEIQSGAKFCTNCGYQLIKAEQSPKGSNTVSERQTQVNSENKRKKQQFAKSKKKSGPSGWIITVLSILTAAVLGFLCYTIFIGPVRMEPERQEKADTGSASLEEQKGLEIGPVSNENGELLFNLDTFAAQMNNRFQNYRQKYSYCSELNAKAIVTDYSYMDRSNIKECYVYIPSNNGAEQEFANISGYDLENRFVDGIVGKMAKIVCHSRLSLEKSIDTSAIFVSIIQIFNPTKTLEETDQLAAQMILNASSETKNYTENGVTYSITMLSEDFIRIEARMQGISSTWDENDYSYKNINTSNTTTRKPKKTEEQLISDMAEISKNNMPNAYCGYDISKSVTGDNYFILKLSYDGIYDAYQSHNMHWLQVINDINDLCSSMKSTWELAGYKNWHVMIHILNDQNYNRILYTSLDGNEYTG